MASGIVVYTSIYGDYEQLLDQAAARTDGIPFVCFTDRSDLVSKFWEVRHVPGPFPSDPGRNSRRAKILAHEYLPEYATSLYIDNSIELLRPADEIVRRLLPPSVGMAQLGHSFRDSVADEFSAVIDEDRDTHWRLCEQFRHYQRDMPDVLRGPATCTGLLVRRHSDPLVRAAMKLWWEHVLRYSRRDQLSIEIAAAQIGIERAVHELDIRGTDFHRWPRDGLNRDPASMVVGARDPHQDCDLWGGLTASAAQSEVESTLRTELRAAHARNAALESRVRALRKRSERLRTARDSAHADVKRMRDSFSWRITTPVRRAASAGRRLITLAARVQSRREMTAYGVKLVANWQDNSFQFCMSGAHGWTLAQALRLEASPFVFVDIGANQGLFSILAAQNTNCRRVFSVEPVPSTLRLLRKNIAVARQRRRISVVPYGISDRDRSVMISVDPRHTGLASVDRPHQGGPEQAVALRNADDLAHKVRSLGHPICIKVDVEGHEAVVLRELQRVGLLAEARWVFYEVSESWSDPEDLERVLREAGFVSFTPTAQGEHYDVLACRPAADGPPNPSVTIES